MKVIARCLVLQTGDFEAPRFIFHTERNPRTYQETAKLDVLDLSDCKLDDDALKCLVEVLGHVKELYLSNNSFTW